MPTSDCRCELCYGAVQDSSCTFLCTACHQELPNLLPSCSQCGEPFVAPPPTPYRQRCHTCQRQPPAYDYSHYRFLFQPPVDVWIRAAKDKRQEHWLLRLAQLMLESPPASLAGVDGLVAVPSHWWSRFKRGYNPAEVLARQISHQTRIPLQHQALLKSRSRDQRGLNIQQRHHNLASTLRNGPIHFDGAHLLLIDDVMTTGATASAAARLLKQNGAAIVGVWALARTPSAQFLRHNGS